jgi:hypothetical protein
MSIDQIQEKRRPGRPRKMDTRAERHPTEADKAPEVTTPVRKRKKMQDRFDGPLYIPNPDPDFVYRWVIDRAENGVRVTRLQARDWEFVTNEEGLQISDSFLFNTKNVGSIYRAPANRAANEFYFLMKIKREWYEEDQQEKQDKIDKTEEGLFQVDKKDGQYGLRKRLEDESD